MEQKRHNNLEEIILYKNIRLIQTALHIFIVKKKLYGSEDEYKDSIFLQNISPIIKSFRANLFRGEKNEVFIDLLLTVATTTRNSIGIETVHEGMFTFRLSCILDQGIKNLRILDLGYGDKLRPFNKKKSLNQDLTPYIYYENYEEEASDFLKSYCPEALLDPIPLPVDDIITKMGLKKVNAILEENVRGMISFKKSKVLQTDYISDGCLAREIEIDAGTVVIGENLLLKSGIGAYNNTLIHECLHWHLHRPYQELQILLNKGTAMIISPSDDEMDNHKERIYKDVFHIENQTRHLTPLVLMPKESSISKFEQLIFKYRDEYDIKSTGIIYKAALKEFAEFFNVSIESARIRLHSLGYTENLYKNTLDYNSDSKNVRFISRWDYERLLESDVKFNMLINKKIVEYIDGYVVINTAPFVIKSEYGQKITNYGLRHIRECTLSFEISKNRNVGFRKSNPAAFALLYHELNASSIQISMNNNQLELILKAYKNTKDKEKKKAFFVDFRFSETKYRFSEYLHIIMERHNISVNQLVISSNLSQSLIKKYRAMTEITYTLEATLAICAGLKLYPYESLNLLSLMGWDYEGLIRRGVKPLDKYNHYYYLITQEYDSGLDKWNEYLSENGIKDLP
ncbi:hypothetical protein, partial [Liberiplasma polymorphum]|uniref:hypothetical protein n=1 Tax=Liberiplasma polymorphum TaxID=3374570 RepID=UPI0037763166